MCQYHNVPIGQYANMPILNNQEFNANFLGCLCSGRSKIIITIFLINLILVGCEDSAKSSKDLPANEVSVAH
jgi:hypothetical protein